MLQSTETKSRNSSLISGTLLSERNTFVVWAILSIPVLLLIVGNSISNDLVTDDFWWLWRLGPEGNSPLGMMPGSTHYSPTVQLLLASWYRLFGINGAAYHVLVSFFYWLGIVATALLAWRISHKLAIGLLAGTIMLLNHQPAQIYVWAVGIWYPVSTLFFILGFWGYLSAVEAEDANKRRRGYVVYLAGLLLGQLTHEQGMTLVGVTGLHTLLMVDRLGEVRLSQLYTLRKFIERVLFFLPPLLLISVAAVARFVVFKEHAAQPLLQFPVYEAWLSILRTFIPGLGRGMSSALSLGLAEGLGPGTTPQIMVFLIQYTLLIVAFMLARRMFKFLILWTVLQIAILLFGLGFLFPRHYYLATIPSILLWSWIIYDFFTWASARLQERAPALKSVAQAGLIVLFGMLLGTTQIPEHRAFQASWRESTEASSRTLESIRQLAAANPQATKLVVLNLPDTLISKNLEWIGVFNAGGREAVEFYNPGRFQDVSFLRTPLDQAPSGSSRLPSNITQPHLPNLYFGIGQDVGFDQVESLAADPTTLVVQFDTQTMNVFQVALRK
jgi:hypothetical protein